MFALVVVGWSWSVVTSGVVATGSPIALDVDFPAFLSRSDPTWRWGSSTANSTRRPGEWVESLFGGNGDLGFQLWSPEPELLWLEVSKKSLWDDRTPDLVTPASVLARNKTWYTGDFAHDQPRLPSGHFELTWGETPSAPLLAVGRVDLHAARATVNVTTTRAGGGFGVAVWASAAYDVGDVIVVETWGVGDGAPPDVRFVAANLTRERCSNCVGDPLFSAPNVTSLPGGGALDVIVQPHLPAKGTAHATAIARVPSGGDAGATVRVVALSSVEQNASAAAAAAAATATAALGALGPTGGLRAAHEAWWAAFWPDGGWVTLDHSKLEAFWWIQLYKFASGASAGRGVHDLLGPWYVARTPWPDVHWDLNLQQTYYLPLDANRPSLSRTLSDYVEWLASTGNLDSNAPPAWRHDSAAAPNGASAISGNETCDWDPVVSPDGACSTQPPTAVGNLLWTLELVDRHASYFGNATLATSVLCPLLRRALAFYAHFQVGGNATHPTISLPPTFSPEYPGPPGDDANYDVSLYRWGLATALRLASRWPGGCGDAADVETWRRTLDALTWFPVDAATDTLEIYRGVPYGTPHRHYSHLMSIWPLGLLDLTNASQLATARSSVNLWLKTPEEDSMFYRPAASAMNVLMGQNAAAFDNVTYLLDRRIEGATWYREGSQGSCTETPYAAAWAVANWMVATRDDVVAVFPGLDDLIRLDDGPYSAAPARAATAQFYRLATRTGAIVSGKRELVARNATHFVTRTALVAVEAPAHVDSSRVFLVQIPMARPLAIKGANAGATFRDVGDDLVEISGLAPSQTVALYSERAPPTTFKFSPLPGCPAEFNHWGLIQPGADPCDLSSTVP